MDKSYTITKTYFFPPKLSVWVEPIWSIWSNSTGRVVWISFDCWWCAFVHSPSKHDPQTFDLILCNGGSPITTSFEILAKFLKLTCPSLWYCNSTLSNRVWLQFIFDMGEIPSQLSEVWFPFKIYFPVWSYITFISRKLNRKIIITELTYTK